MGDHEVLEEVGQAGGKVALHDGSERNYLERAGETPGVVHRHSEEDGSRDVGHQQPDVGPPGKLPPPLHPASVGTLLRSVEVANLPEVVDEDVVGVLVDAVVDLVLVVKGDFQVLTLISEELNEGVGVVRLKGEVVETWNVLHLQLVGPGVLHWVPDGLSGSVDADGEVIHGGYACCDCGSVESDEDDVVVLRDGAVHYQGSEERPTDIRLVVVAIATVPARLDVASSVAPISSYQVSIVTAIVEEVMSISTYLSHDRRSAGESSACRKPVPAYLDSTELITTQTRCETIVTSVVAKVTAILAQFVTLTRSEGGANHKSTRPACDDCACDRVAGIG